MKKKERGVGRNGGESEEREIEQVESLGIRGCIVFFLEFSSSQLGLLM